MKPLKHASPLLLSLLLGQLAGCDPKEKDPAPKDDTSGDTADTADTADTVDSADSEDTGPTPSWDPDPPAWDCANELEAPLLEQALLDAGLPVEAIGWSEDEYRKTSYIRYLNDDFLLPWFRGLQQDVGTIPCFAATRTRALSHYAGLGHPLSGALWTAMEPLGTARHDTPLRDSAWPDFESGLQALLDATGDSTLSFKEPSLPEGLGTALGPIFGAMAAQVTAWSALAASAPDREIQLSNYGHGGVILDFRSAPDLGEPSVRDWVLSEDGPRSLQAPSLDLLWAVEQANLATWAGQGAEGLLFELETSMGRIRIQGPSADSPGELEDTLFLLDLGGDDTYVHASGANGNGMPLSLMIDLGGQDSYGYTPVADPGDEGRLASDEAGRYGGDDNYGPFSLSRTGRAGSGRFGTGILLDLGSEADRYATLRMGQGWGHLGVGILYDQGGDDTYEGEAGVQGGASMGIGILYDGGGDDTYRSYVQSQGFAYTQAVGMLIDVGEGNDTFYANPGNPDVGGDPMYYSPQMPARANSSFSQGVGFGMRNDSESTFLSGGLGFLIDGGGDDSYTASTFAQGSGYWQGLGLLSDAGGNDSYDAYYYVQGGAAHYAIGALLDQGGDDRLNQILGPTYMQFGAGHDFSVGLYIDESGDDTYTFAGLAAGASNCQGIGLMVDNQGADTYNALSTYSTGLGNHSGECGADSGARANVHSIGLFLDSGGDPDTWIWPEGDTRVPADDSSFGIEWAGTKDEHGGAVDGSGETALHAAGSL